MNNTAYQLNQPKQRQTLLYILILLVGLLLSSFMANADEKLEAAKLDNQERIKRLSDIPMNTEGWYMTMPTMQSSSSRTGLQTAGYSALHEDMLEAMNDLADDANKELALNRLENIRDRVENRIVANLDADYLYAAGVYIDMLEDIAPRDDKITMFRQQVADRKAFKAFVEKFDAALAENRLQSPASDCASHYLEQMRQLQYSDAAKLAEAEARFKRSTQLAMNG